MSNLVSVQKVTRKFGEITALSEVDLEIDSGRIVGLLGPNGAGKTTLLSLIQGLRRPTSGTVRLFGEDPTNYRSRQKLGSTPQETALPATLRVGEVIDLVGAHFADRISREALAKEFGLSDLLRRQTGSLSGGQKRRLSVALAFCGKPRLVLLDEPTTGLDVDARRALWEAVRRQNEAGSTVVVTSHYLEEIEALADRVIVIGEGRVLADDRLRAVLAKVGLTMIRLNSPKPLEVAKLRGVVKSRQEDDGSYTYFASDADAVVTELIRAKIPFKDLSVRGASLEEAFLTLTDSKAARTQKTETAESTGSKSGADPKYKVEVST